MRCLLILFLSINIFGQYGLGGIGLLPDIHCKEELLSDLKDSRFDASVEQLWFCNFYSTSKHLHVLTSILYGLQAKTTIEIGFGRSTFCLGFAAACMDGKLVSVDRYDYSGYLEYLPKFVKDQIQFVQGDAKKLFQTDHLNDGVDFMFLDYFSSRERSADSIYKAIHRFLPYMRQNGIIAVHDTIEKKYFVKDAFKRLRKDKKLEVMSLPYNYGLGLIRKLDKSEYGTIEDNWKKKDDK